MKFPIQAANVIAVAAQKAGLMVGVVLMGDQHEVKAVDLSETERAEINTRGAGKNGYTIGYMTKDEYKELVFLEV